MSNYIDQLLSSKTQQPMPLAQTVQVTQAQPQTTQKQVEAFGTNLLEKFLHQQGVTAAAAINTPAHTPVSDYKNTLRTKFQNNEANILGIIIRNFNAKDISGDQLLRGDDVKGNFNNAVERLDEIKALGINTLHILPIHEPGKKNAKGTAGSLYSPKDFLAIDPALDDKKDPRTVKEEFKNFIDECHKRGIAVMLDLPSCASFDLFEQRPELMAIDENGIAKTPGGWDDIKMFNPWKDKTKKELNPALMQMHKDYVDMCVELGVDGIRSDVSRTKPTEFWDILIDYSHQKDPEFAWLAESYTYEDASPQVNMDYDRPKDMLKAKFDSVYGQYHIYHEWSTANEFHKYVTDNLMMSDELEKGKSIIGSFGTHDDISLMNHGGPDFLKQVAGLEATMPMMNTYFMDGFQTGDDYVYDFENSEIPETETDSHKADVHHGRPDIFNFSRPLIGKHPDIGEFMKESLKFKESHKDIITKGSYIPLYVDGNGDDRIIAFARHYKGRTILVVANKDVNARQQGSIIIPGLNANQKLKNALPTYGDKSIVQAESNRLNVDLGKSRMLVFEIDTPNIERSGLDLYKQNL